VVALVNNLPDLNLVIPVREFSIFIKKIALFVKNAESLSPYQ